MRRASHGNNGGSGQQPAGFRFGEQLLLFADCGIRPLTPHDAAISVGAPVQIDSLLATCEGGKTYVYMQRGIVEALDATTAHVRIVAAPPHYPYLHPLDGKLVIVPIADLTPAAIPNYAPAAAAFPSRRRGLRHKACTTVRVPV